MSKTLMLTIFLAAYYVLKLISAWEVFVKYGEEGWKGIVPFYCDYVEFSLLWDSRSGIIYIASTIVCCALSPFATASIIFRCIEAAAVCLSFMFSLILAYKKAMVFHKSSGFALLLYVIPFIGNIILGFGSCVYNPYSVGEMNPLTGRDI